MNNNKKLIPISGLVSASVITLAEIQENEKLPGMNQWVAMAMVYFGLSAMADLGLPISGGFAVLIMITVLLTRGDHALAFTQQKIRKGPQGPMGPRRPGNVLEPIEPFQTV